MLDKERITASLKESTKYIGDCWVFTGANSSRGHGQVRIENKLYIVSRLSAHFFLGLDLNNSKSFACHKDELCKFRACWNPEHLYIGNAQSNVRDMVKSGAFNGWQKSKSRVVVCKRGHEFTPENTYITPDHKRRCITCQKKRMEEFYARRADNQ